jgi:hypothetical protein
VGEARVTGGSEQLGRKRQGGVWRAVSDGQTLVWKHYRSRIDIGRVSKSNCIIHHTVWHPFFSLQCGSSSFLKGVDELFLDLPTN